MKKTKSMFPMNTKTHSMETRSKEKFMVNPAKTERLKKSAVIFMQTMLNREDQQAKPFKTPNN